MNPELLRKGQTALNVLWVVLAVSFVLPTSEWTTLLRGVFAVMLAAHALEFVILGRSLAKLGGSMPRHLVGVLLYGFFHIQLARHEAEEASATP